MKIIFPLFCFDLFCFVSFRFDNIYLFIHLVGRNRVIRVFGLYSIEGPVAIILGHVAIILWLYGVHQLENPANTELVGLGNV